MFNLSPNPNSNTIWLYIASHVHIHCKQSNVMVQIESNFHYSVTKYLPHQCNYMYLYCRRHLPGICMCSHLLSMLYDAQHLSNIGLQVTSAHTNLLYNYRKLCLLFNALTTSVRVVILVPDRFISYLLQLVLYSCYNWIALSNRWQARWPSVSCCMYRYEHTEMHQDVIQVPW